MSNTGLHSPAPPKFNRNAFKEVAWLFFKIGIIGFGGPAATTGLMYEETVERRGWLENQHFLDLLGITNLLPGVSTTKLAMYLGYVRAGWWGIPLACFFFTLPATVIVIGLAMVYMAYGAIPPSSWLLYGVKPVIIAIILQALVHLGKPMLKRYYLAIITLVVLVLYLLGVNELILLLGGIGIAFFYYQFQSRSISGVRGFTLPLLIPLSGLVLQNATTYSLKILAVTFLKIGTILVGGGYVLLAYLRSEFVGDLHWLTDTQLIDAVAVGQFTPGPLFTTAAFIGYILGGIVWAVVAIISIILPSILYVVVTIPFINRLRKSTEISALLDGVNAVALGLMAAVTWQLGRSALVDLPTVLIAIIALIVSGKFKLNPVWLVLGGGLISVVAHLLLG